MSSSRVRTNQNIQVYVRCRPINERERLIRSHEMVQVPSPREIVVKSSLNKKFTFDRTFGPESEQHEVYKAVVAPLIEEVLAGYNCTVFAYGQTGTGKTHTMVGDATTNTSSAWDDRSDVGIIPRALSHLFEELRLTEMEFSMRVSYLELYNEELSDLLASGELAQIRIFDDANKKGSIIVQGLEEIPVHNTSDVYKLLAKGAERRKIAPTLMNAQSSRSHTIFSILVHIKENGMDGEELMKIGKLNLVDLAGSENISKTGNERGIRARESVNINQSLLTLGRVITALVERTPHIPYRESKLTRLLQESLGGRTKTSIIATISPGHKDIEETVNTLEYAHRAKNIQNKPEINQKLTKKTVLKEYTEEIDKLKRDLEAAREKNGVYLAQETFNEMQYQIDTNNREISEKTAHIRALKELMESKERLFTEVSLNLTERTKQLKHIEGDLDNTKKVLDTTQRRYQEKKQILNSHKLTEILLSGQAKELINVAENASTETYRLHDNIERRRMTEMANKQVCEQFDVSMNGHFEGMATDLQTFTDDFTQQTKRILEQIKKDADNGKSTVTEATGHLKVIVDCAQNGKREIEENVTKRRLEFDNLLDKHNEAKKLRLENGETMRKDAEKDSKNEQLAINTNLNVQFSAYESLEKLIMQHVAHLNQFNQTFKTTIGKNSEIIKTLQESQRTIEGKTTEHDVLLNQLVEFVGNYAASARATNTAIKAVQPTLESTETLVRTCENELQTAVTAINFGLNNGTVAINTNITNAKEVHSSIQAQVSTVFEAHQTVTAAFVDKMNGMEVEYEKQTGELNEKLNGMIDDISTVNETTEINLTGGLENIISQLGNEKARIKTNQDEMNKMHGHLEELQKSATKAMHDRVNHGQSRLRTFQTNELKIYTPTGQTPNKRDYQYPKDLAATQPHSLIVRRFWDEYDGSPLDCSGVISEDGDLEGLCESSIDNKSTSASPLNLPFAVNVSDRALRQTHSANSTPTFNTNGHKLSKSANSSATIATLPDKENTL